MCNHASNRFKTYCTSLASATHAMPTTKKVLIQLLVRPAENNWFVCPGLRASWAIFYNIFATCRFTRLCVGNWLQNIPLRRFLFAKISQPSYEYVAISWYNIKGEDYIFEFHSTARVISVLEYRKHFTMLRWWSSHDYVYILQAIHTFRTESVASVETYSKQGRNHI
jgi:hypothetical protein